MIWIRPVTSSVFWTKRKSLRDAVSKIKASQGDRFFVVKSTKNLHKLCNYKLDDELFNWVNYPPELDNVLSAYEFDRGKLVKIAH
jgi:hypothetical protein